MLLFNNRQTKNKEIGGYLSSEAMLCAAPRGMRRERIPRQTVLENRALRCCTSRKRWIDAPMKRTMFRGKDAFVFQSKLPVGRTPQPMGAERSETFSYKDCWYPVMPLSLIDTKKPHLIQLLGDDLVLWHDGTEWRCLNNTCPHRNAPLSEGKIMDSGAGKTLMCSYHGWKFKGDGSCVSIPQASSKEKEDAICGNPRSCGKAYATREAQGLLWVFPGDVKEDDAAYPPIPVCPMIEKADENDLMYIMPPFFRDLPYDFSTLLENVADPSHVPFSHHSVQGNRNNVKYGMYDMEFDGSGNPSTQEIESDTITVNMGTERGLFVSNLQYHQPCLVRYFGKQGEENFTSFNIFCVPTKPGHSRLISYIATTRKFPAVVRFLLRLPEFFSHVFVRNKVLDGDSVFLHNQEHYIRKQMIHNKKTLNDLYYLPNSSDLLLSSIRTRLGKLGSPYDGTVGMGGFGIEIPPLITDHKVILNRFEQHTKNCRKCLQALRITNALHVLAACGACLSVVWMLYMYLSQGTLRSVSLPGLFVSVFALGYKLLSDLKKQFYYLPYVHNEK